MGRQVAKRNTGVPGYGDHRRGRSTLQMTATRATVTLTLEVIRDAPQSHLLLGGCALKTNWSN
jgi:hypothetical protein